MVKIAHKIRVQAAALALRWRCESGSRHEDLMRAGEGRAFPQKAMGPIVSPNQPARLRMQFTLEINGRAHTVDVDADTPLLWVLRDEINLKGTKFGCGAGLCGACTVHLNGAPVRSCRLPVSNVGEAAVTTIEGLAATAPGARLQRAWLEVDVLQCGYCQAGQLMSATALLARVPAPSDADIDSAMNGNICRCGTYLRIREAIKRAAKMTLGSSATRRL
jgi:isoquinoline 1-oxidoreductase subunit alpha